MKQPSRFRRAVYGAIAGVTAFGALSGLAVGQASAAATVTNLSGADRYQTAGNLQAAKFGSGGVSTVVLADAIPGNPTQNYAGGHESDALAASGYAGLNKYGILLTDNGANPGGTTSCSGSNASTVPANTLSALKSLGVKNVIAIGGASAVCPGQVSSLTAAGYTVTQPFQGTDRYATMQMIDNSFTSSTVGKDSSGNNTAILASGDATHLVDALAAGGLAYGKKLPVVLSSSGSSTLGTQAAAVLSNLGIKHLLVVGGTASLPESQYCSAGTITSGTTTTCTSNITGVNTVTVYPGTDRSNTAQLLAADEVANWGFGKTAVSIAAGSTYFGSPSNNVVQNDGADALSGASFNGDPTILCLSNGPTNEGSLTGCVKVNQGATTINQETGSANMPSSQVTDAVNAASGTGSPSSFTVTGGSLTATSSTSTAQSQGAQQYSVSGLPANQNAVIALFPCTGNTQTGNNTVNGAPTTNSSGTTFTAPGGTSPAAGSAVGEGTSQLNNNGSGTGLNGTNASNNSVPGFSSTAYIASVNGVPTPTNLGTNGTGGPTAIVAPTGSGGTVSFVVNSYSFDCAVPVVYTVPSSVSTSAGNTGSSVPPLVVDKTGAPSAGYSTGVGSPTFWQAPAAPSTATPYDVTVVFVLGNTFDGLAVCTSDCPTGVTTGKIYAYNIGTSGDAFGYTDKTPVTQAAFASYLSGPGTSYLPNTTTSQDVAGDMVTVGSNGIQTTGYSSSSPANFQLQAASSGSPAASTLSGGDPTYAKNAGDVPAAATNVTAQANACAFQSGSPATCQPGVLVSWTAPANPDVSGSQATPGGVSANTGDAQYSVFRETVTTGTTGSTTFSAPTWVGTVTVVQSGFTGTISNQPGGNTPVGSPQMIDTAPTTTPAVYYVVATPATGTSSGCAGSVAAGTMDTPTSGGTAPCSGPASTTSGQVTGTASSQPKMLSAVVTPGVGTCTVGSGACSDTGTITNGHAGYIVITYNTAVSCLSAAGPDFVYSNSGGSPTNVKGSKCWDNTNGAGNTVSTSTPTSTQIEIDFSNTFQSGTNSTGGPIYSATNIAAPGTGDTLTYTQPSTATTSNTVYATGTQSNPVFAVSPQTLTDNGNPNATTNSGTATSPSNPLI